MKEKVNTDKTGKAWTSLTFEVGDKGTFRFSKVGSNEPYAAKRKDGSTFVGQTHYIGVTTSDGKEVTVNLTKTQKAGLDKMGDLKGKAYEVYEYTGKSEYNKGKKLVGIRVK